MNRKMREIILKQAMAARAANIAALEQTDALIMLLDEDQGEADACQHPEDQRDTSAATQGEPHAFFCRACKETVNGNLGS